MRRGNISTFLPPRRLLDENVTATHIIGIYGSRDLTVYNLGTNYASVTYNFVPNGSTVTKVHDVIRATKL